MAQYALIENLTHTVTSTAYAVVTGSAQDLSEAEEVYFSVSAPTSHAVAVVLEFSSDSGFTGDQTRLQPLDVVPAGGQREARIPLNRGEFSFMGYPYYDHVRLKVLGVASTGGACVVDSWLKRTT